MFKTILLFIIVAGAIQGLFLALLIVSKKGENSKAKAMLAALMCSFSVSIAHGFVPTLLQDIGVIPSSPAGYKLGDPSQLLFGPFYYLYVLFLTGPQRRFTLPMLLHFLPSLFLSVFSIYFSDTVFSGTISGLVWMIIILQMWIYLLAVHKLITGYRNTLKENFSDIEGINLKWITFSSITLAVVYSIYTVFVPMLLHSNDPYGHLDKSATLILAIAVYSFGYRGLTNTYIFTSPPEITGSQSNRPEKNYINHKYKKSSLSRDEIGKRLSLLESYMETSRPFLDPELTASKLAEQCGISMHHLSETINRGAGKKFYDFVNGYRILEVIRLMQNPEKRAENTLLSLAFEAGFNSKATFNKCFKNETGLTPSQYINQLDT